MKTELRGHHMSIYEPIYDKIGETIITLKKIFNQRGIIFNLKIAKKTNWKRNKH